MRVVDHHLIHEAACCAIEDPAVLHVCLYFNGMYIIYFLISQYILSLFLMFMNTFAILKSLTSASSF